MFLTDPYFWFLLMIVMFALEIIGAGFLYATIFALASLITGIVAMNTDNTTIILLTFIVSIIANFFIIKPLAKKYLKSDETIQRSNIDALKGQTGVVTTAVLPGKKGYISLDGTLWMAKEEEGRTLEEGAVIELLRIEGVTAIVRQKQDEGN